MEKISSMLIDSDNDSSLSHRICSVGVSVLGADGVSLSITGHHTLSSETSSEIEYSFLDEQQFTFGDGPSFEASFSNVPISAHDFTSKRDKKSWPIFSSIATSKGVHSMIAFPLRVGNSPVAVLSAYRKRKEEISSDQYVDGLTLSLITGQLLVQQLAGEDKPNLEKIIENSSKDQSFIHLASGMISEKLNISIIDAMVRIRAYAYKSGIPLTEVATKIVERQLNIEE